MRIASRTHRHARCRSLASRTRRPRTGPCVSLARLLRWLLQWAGPAACGACALRPPGRAPAARACVRSLTLLAVVLLCARSSRAQPAGVGARALRQRAFAHARAGNTEEAARVFGTVAELEPGVCARAPAACRALALWLA